MTILTLLTPDWPHPFHHHQDNPRPLVGFAIVAGLVFVVVVGLCLFIAWSVA